MTKRKADCTPEEWGRISEYAKARYQKTPQQRATTRLRRFPAKTEAERLARKATSSARTRTKRTPEQKEAGHKKDALRMRVTRALWSPEDKRKKQAQAREWRTGIGGVLLDTLLVHQQNKCAVCGREFTQDRGRVGPQADHDHDTQTPRGLLCRACNLAEGFIKQTGLSPQGFADRLQSYLDNPPALLVLAILTIT